MKYTGIIAMWILVTISVTAVVTKIAQTHDDPPSLADRLEHAQAILSEVPLIDGHNDLPTTIWEGVNFQLANFPFHENLTDVEPWASMSNSVTDLPRMRAGMIGAQFFSLWSPCDSQYMNSLAQMLQEIDIVQRLVQKYPDDLQLVTTADGILDAHAKGKIGALMGMEGGHSIDSALGTLRLAYNEGVRYMTLTHDCNTPWADSWVAENVAIEFDGLTAWGELVVKEMNRIGMMVDIAHVASQTMRDVLAVTRAPVIFSHGDSRALCNFTRNIPDDVLRQMPENGGVVMVDFMPTMVTCSDTATIQDIVAQINYIRDLAGVDHIGLGSDFDGMPMQPEGLEDVSKFPYLFAELLLDPRWTDEDLKKLAGLNLIRTLQEVERVRDELLTETPWEQIIPEEDLAGHLDCVNKYP